MDELTPDEVEPCALSEFVEPRCWLHRYYLLVLVRAPSWIHFCIRPATFWGVSPKASAMAFSGALAPKRSIPTIRPSPMIRYQSTPPAASTATSFVFASWGISL